MCRDAQACERSTPIRTFPLHKWLLQQSENGEVAHYHVSLTRPNLVAAMVALAAASYSLCHILSTARATCPSVNLDGSIDCSDKDEGGYDPNGS